MANESQLLDAPDARTVAALEAENVCLLAVAETAMAHLYVLAASVEACGHVCGRPGRCGVLRGGRLRRRETHVRTFERHDGETAVECPDCGFCFDSDHEDSGAEGGYSCPACAEIALREVLGSLLNWVNQSPTLSNADLIPGWWLRGRRIRERAERLVDA